MFGKYEIVCRILMANRQIFHADFGRSIDQEKRQFIHASRYLLFNPSHFLGRVRTTQLRTPNWFANLNKPNSPTRLVPNSTTKSDLQISTLSTLIKTDCPKWSLNSLDCYFAAIGPSIDPRNSYKNWVRFCVILQIFHGNGDIVKFTSI